MASKIYKSLVPLSEYMDRKFKGTKAEYDKAIAESPWCARALRGAVLGIRARARGPAARPPARRGHPQRAPFVRSLPSRAPSPRAPPAFAPSLPPRAPLSPLRDSPPSRDIDVLTRPTQRACAPSPPPPPTAGQQPSPTDESLYVGNLSFFTKEEQIAEVFGKAGELDRVVMGLDRNTKTPCGFCFVIFKTRQGAERAVAYLNGTMLDEREIRADFDWGFEDGRQFGRGKSGGQMRDEYRTEYDQERGGYGKVMEAELRGGGGAGFGSPGFGGSPGFRGGGVPPPGPRRQPQQQQQPVRPQKRSRPSDEGGDAKRARGEENARFAREREQDDEED